MCCAVRKNDRRPSRRVTLPTESFWSTNLILPGCILSRISCHTREERKTEPINVSGLFLFSQDLYIYDSPQPHPYTDRSPTRRCCGRSVIPCASSVLYSTPTIIVYHSTLPGIHRSKDHSLSDYSNWYTYRRVCVSQSDTLKRLTAIEPQQKIQNEFVSSEDNIKCTRHHEYSPNSTTRTTRVYQSTRPGTLSDESA
jgi:hypothetical protein